LIVHNLNDLLVDYKLVSFSFDVASASRSLGLEIDRNSDEREQTRYCLSRLEQYSVEGKSHEISDVKKGLEEGKPALGFLRLDEKTLGWNPEFLTGQRNSFWVLFTSASRNVGAHVDGENAAGEFQFTTLCQLVGTATAKVWLGDQQRDYKTIRLKPGIGIIILPGQRHEVIPVTPYAVKLSATLVGGELRGLTDVPATFLDKSLVDR